MNLNKKITFQYLKKLFSKWGFSKKGLIKNTRGEWYLILQILIISLHFIPAYPKITYIPNSISIVFIFVGLLISIKGIIITINAFIDLGDNITPLPYPIKGSILIKNNSYQLSRHPIYKGLLFTSLGISISISSILHIFLFILLAYILKIKALKEEEKLKLKFADYQSYIKEVPAIIKSIKYLDWRS